MKEVRYFYVPDAALRTELPVDEALHAMRVLRLQSGDEMFLMDGAGCFYRAEVAMASAKRCMYRICDTMPQTKTWHGRIHLAMAPTKMMERVEWFSEKATEIGVDELSFLSCKFSERKVLKTERIDKIVISAIKQSRKPWKPVVNDMISFKDFISQPRQGRKFIAHCYDEVDRKDFLDTLFADDGLPGDEEITVMIGPEGDFSIDEVRMAIDNGFESITLGQSRLRTETAALSAVMMSQVVMRKK